MNLIESSWTFLMTNQNTPGGEKNFEHISKLLKEIINALDALAV